MKLLLESLLEDPIAGIFNYAMPPVRFVSDIAAGEAFLARHPELENLAPFQRAIDQWSEGVITPFELATKCVDEAVTRRIADFVEIPPDAGFIRL